MLLPMHTGASSKSTLTRNGSVVTIQDEGPGIADIDKAMQEGYSTASDKVREMGFGAGMGLSNMKKNSDQLMISSEINKGTVVEMTTYMKSKQ